MIFHILLLLRALSHLTIQSIIMIANICSAIVTAIAILVFVLEYCIC